MSEPLKTTNVLSLINYIKNSTIDILSTDITNQESNYEDRKNEISNLTNKFLKSVSNRGLKNYKVEVHDSTWTYYYPNFWKRIWAISTYYLFIKTNLIQKSESNYKKFKWYHYILPFQIVIEKVTDWERVWYEYGENLEINSKDLLENIIENYTTLTTKALFKAKHDELPVDIYITPIQAVEYIKLNFVVKKEK